STAGHRHHGDRVEREPGAHRVGVHRLPGEGDHGQRCRRRQRGAGRFGAGVPGAGRRLGRALARAPALRLAISGFPSSRPTTYGRMVGMRRTVGTLVMLRHGESEWNAKNLFTGWVDVDLTAQGEAEARRGGDLLREHDLLPDVVHTSVLRRAIRTAEISLNGLDRQWIPVRRSWRLNERHYGALQGKNKKQTLETYGEEQFMLWRSSYDTPPPPIAEDDEFSQFDDPPDATLPPDAQPRTECLNDVLARALPY